MMADFLEGTMKVHGTRFGSLTFVEEDLISLEDGLMGFPVSKRFLLFPYSESSAFFLVAICGRTRGGIHCGESL